MSPAGSPTGPVESIQISASRLPGALPRLNLCLPPGRWLTWLPGSSLPLLPPHRSPRMKSSDSVRAADPLTRLGARHDELLQRIDELDARIERALSDFAQARDHRRSTHSENRMDATIGAVTS